MTPSTEKIVITHEELLTPQVAAILQKEQELRAARHTSDEAPAAERLIYKSWFSLMIAGLIGALLAWCLIEPLYSDRTARIGDTLFLLSGVAGFVALFVGGAEGALARNPSRSAKGALIGLAIGVGGGMVTFILGGIVYGLLAEMLGSPGSQLILPLQMMRRSLAWGIAGMTMGLGPGIALRSRQLTLNGFLGGALGGLLGGLVFDPIDFLLYQGEIHEEAHVSRLAGFLAIGGTVGAMIGLVEMMSKEAWLLMTEGPLAGKQFVLYRDVTSLGSSPRCEVYLFKDPAVAAVHATIRKVRDGYLLEDQESPTGTFVNARAVKQHRLESGDEICVGKAKFTYSERPRASAR